MQILMNIAKIMTFLYYSNHIFELRSESYSVYLTFHLQQCPFYEKYPTFFLLIFENHLQVIATEKILDTSKNYSTTSPLSRVGTYTNNE